MLQNTRLRFVSVFRRGWIAIFVSLICHQSLPLSRFIPEPWTQARMSAYASLIHT